MLEDKGERAASLIRRVIASHGQPAETVLKKALPPGVTIPKGLILPAGPQWPELIGWCLGQIDRLPPSALAAAIALFEGWLTLAAFGERTISPLLLERLADVLVAEIEERDLPLPKPGEALPKIKYAVGRDGLETARLRTRTLCPIITKCGNALPLGHRKIQATQSADAAALRVPRKPGKRRTCRVLCDVSQFRQTR